MGAGRFLRAIEFLREGAVQNVVDQSGLARAGDAGDYGEQAEGESDIDIFEIVGAGAEDLDGFPLGCGAFPDRDLSGAAEISASEDSALAAISAGLPCATR